MSENLTKSGKRFTCLTPEQQADFDHLQPKAQKYIIYRAQGFSKKGAYVAAGYKDSQNSTNGARVLESRIANFEELLSAFSGHNERLEAYKEGTATSKKIDEIAENGFEMPPIVPAELEGVQDKIDFQNMTRETAEKISMLRRIANGTIKYKKTTTVLDKQGEIKETKVEEISDPLVRMKAREQLDRALGLNDMLQIGQIKAGSITINIVDASKDEPEVIDAGKAEFVDE